MLNAAICIKGYRIPNKRSRAAPPRTDVALKCVYWEGEAFRNVQTLQGSFYPAYSQAAGETSAGSSASVHACVVHGGFLACCNKML